ncbi:hypothetical protein BV898_01346 [Hypsibius exemplaris]|uniref:Uncharacterized protein n=1 Tax=Hypsibius exemplaris TaxID=2072580 RepID=A0A1W0XBF5_HYPEX|nr:hypothetical protein BV898_01346 [Hypsibius exemplaris]
MDEPGPSHSPSGSSSGLPTAIRHTLTVQRPNTAGSGSGSGSRKSSVSDCDSPSAGSDFHVSSLTYRDFFPKLLEEGSSFKSPIYEEFGFLIARANEWLSSHREFDVLNVECVEILTPHNTKVVDPSKAAYIERNKDWTEFVRGLRMWLIPALPKGRTHTKPGWLRYFDVVPECTHAGIVSIEYTRLSGLVEALNDKLRHQPINGDIMAVQTLTLRFHSNEGVDSNRTCFSLHGQKQRIRLYFLRVFYMEFGDASSAKLECLEDIGIVDFVPQIMRHTTTGRQHIEPLSSVITRSGDWFIRYQEDGHPGLRVVNIQTVVLHVKDSKNTDTQQTFYMATGDGERFFYELRFIRLIYARQTKSECLEPLPVFPRVFMKLFCPTQTLTAEAHSKRHPKFGNVPDIVGRVQEWISEDHPPIIGIETHGYSSYFGDEIIITAESPYLYDQGHEDKFWIQSIRVYYEGDYVESSQELPSPGLRKERRGSSVHGKRPVEHRLSGSAAAGSPGSGSGQGSWPPLAAGSTLAPVDSTETKQESASPRLSPRRRSTKEDLGHEFREFNRAQEASKNDKECRIS